MHFNYLNTYTFTVNDQPLITYQNFQPVVPPNVKISISSVNWSGGTATVLNVVFRTGPNTDDVFIFQLDGAPFPTINSLASLAALEQGITSFEAPTGTFAPGQYIPFDKITYGSVRENDRINGTEHIDELYGGKGNDRMSGKQGTDLMFGGNGNDVLNGNSGRDLLYAGKGDDILTGGRGNDTFIFGSVTRKWGNDTITDFDAFSRQEKINLQDVGSIKNFNDLSKNHMTQVGDDVVIDALRGKSITLLDTELNDLDKSDFIF